jgi:hypothetical protein
MAQVSLKKKKQLIDRIKHGVKKYRFSIQRYGGETVVGTITPYQYHYWKNRQQELTDYIMGGDRDNYQTEHDLPEDARFASDWYEIDNVVHMCGAPIESGACLHIDEFDQDGNAIKDEKGNLVLREPIDLDNDNVHKFGIQYADQECIDVDHPSLKNQYYLYAYTVNKGSWTVDNDIEIEGELDLKQVKLHYKSIEGSDICYAISYADGEPIHLEEDSTGKSQECRVMEGYMDEQSMSKKQKEEIARAEAEAPQPDTDTVQEDDNELPMTPEQPKASDEGKKKSKTKAKKKAKGKKKK